MRRKDPRVYHDEIVDLNRTRVFLSWAVQGKVNPLTAARSEGVRFWEAGDRNRAVEITDKG